MVNDLLNELDSALAGPSAVAAKSIDDLKFTPEIDPKWYDTVEAEDGTISHPVKQFGPGIYLDMPIEVYHSQLAVSNSGIKLLLKSPWHYWASSPLNPNRMPFKSGPALIKGQKFHKYLLEQDTFFDDYDIKEGTATSNATNKATGKLYVGEGELEGIKTAVNVLKTMIPKVVDICLQNARTEVSMFWVDPATGVLCRCRHDIFKPRVSTDYKTSAEVSPRACLAALTNYDYPIQGAFYLDGNKAVFANHLSDFMREKLELDDRELEFIKEHSNYCFLFQESSYPFTPYAITIEDDIIEKGRDMYSFALQIYADNMAQYGTTTPWPAFGDSIVGVGKDELDFYGKGWYLHKEV